MKKSIEKRDLLVSFNQDTGEVLGYYPSFIEYKNIPEPIIPISVEDHSKYLGKKMMVKNGVLQEYKESQEEIFKQKQILLISSRKSYLESTDWQANAFVKYDRPIDNSVKEKCKLANKEINEIEVCTTLEQLNKYSIEF